MAEGYGDPIPIATTEVICSTCREIDFSKVALPYANQPHADPNPNLLGEFIDLNASFVELKLSNCPLCRLFGSMEPLDYEPSENKSCRLIVVSALYTFTRSAYKMIENAEMVDYPLLVVFDGPRDDDKIRSVSSLLYYNVEHRVRQTGYLSPFEDDRAQSGFGIRRLRCDQVDLKFVEGYLHHCHSVHGVCCSIPPSSVVDLKVIDCKSQRILNAPPDCKYIALSYVWSESPSSTMPLSETMDMTELHEVPQVIKDCMDLAVSLGYRYVWCDRYCINQDDEEKKAAQIAQMDLIYAQAQITVIAAAPGDGLRGINGSQRRRQPGLRVNDWTVLSTLPHPAHTINASKWKTRGWTYQEGLLSVRRLIFGEHQVIFECNGISCAEASVYPLAKMLPEEDLDPRIPGGKIFTPESRQTAIESVAFSLDAFSFMDPISSYYSRQLTFPSDRLKALEGIFAALTKTYRPVYAMMGILMIPTDYELLGPQLVVPPHIHASHRFVKGLTWRHIIPGIREYEFPSWTWAGWKGGSLDKALATKVGVIGNDWIKFDYFANINLWIDDTEEHLAFPVFETLPPFAEWARRSPRYIYIEGPIIDISIVLGNSESLYASRKWTPLTGDLSSFYEWYAEIESTETGIYYAPISLSRQVNRPMGSTIGLLLEPSISGTRNDVHNFATVLVLEDMGDYFERLGIFTSWEGKLISGTSVDDIFHVEDGEGRQWWRRLTSTAPKRKIKIG